MDTINFNLRISEETNEKLIKIAKEEGRSKNKQIEQIIKEYIEKYECNKSTIEINQNNNKNAIVKLKR